MSVSTIFDIQRNSFVDGPGIRTTVFFKGCNLRCKWCHTPESQNFEKEILFYQNKCTGCGRCKDITADSTDFICFNDAKEICGREYTVDGIPKKSSFFPIMQWASTNMQHSEEVRTSLMHLIMKRLKNLKTN